MSESVLFLKWPFSYQKFHFQKYFLVGSIRYELGWHEEITFMFEKWISLEVDFLKSGYFEKWIFWKMDILSCELFLKNGHLWEVDF